MIFRKNAETCGGPPREVEPLAHLLGTLEKKLSAQGRYQVGSLGLLENKVERSLSKSVEATRGVPARSAPPCFHVLSEP